MNKNMDSVVSKEHIAGSMNDLERFCSNLKTLMQYNDDTWQDKWKSTMYQFRDQWRNNLKMMNPLLEVIQYALNSHNDKLIVQAFSCWKYFIEHYEEMNLPPNIIDVLLRPLIANKHYTSVVAIEAKLMTWDVFLNTGLLNIPQVAEKTVLRLLKFLYENEPTKLSASSVPSLVGTCGLVYMKLLLKIIHSKLDDLIFSYFCNVFVSLDSNGVKFLEIANSIWTITLNHVVDNGWNSKYFKHLFDVLMNLTETSATCDNERIVYFLLQSVNNVLSVKRPNRVQDCQNGILFFHHSEKYLSQLAQDSLIDADTFWIKTIICFMKWLKMAGSTMNEGTVTNPTFETACKLLLFPINHLSDKFDSKLIRHYWRNGYVTCVNNTKYYSKFNASLISKLILVLGEDSPIQVLVAVLVVVRIILTSTSYLDGTDGIRHLLIKVCKKFRTFSMFSSSKYQPVITIYISSMEKYVQKYSVFSNELLPVIAIFDNMRSSLDSKIMQKVENMKNVIERSRSLQTNTCGSAEQVTHVVSGSLIDLETSATKEVAESAKQVTCVINDMNSIDLEASNPKDIVASGEQVTCISAHLNASNDDQGILEVSNNEQIIQIDDTDEDESSASKNSNLEKIENQQTLIVVTDDPTASNPKDIVASGEQVTCVSAHLNASNDDQGILEVSNNEQIIKIYDTDEDESSASKNSNLEKVENHKPLIVVTDDHTEIKDDFYTEDLVIIALSKTEDSNVNKISINDNVIDFIDSDIDIKESVCQMINETFVTKSTESVDVPLEKDLTGETDVVRGNDSKDLDEPCIDVTDSSKINLIDNEDLTESNEKSTDISSKINESQGDNSSDFDDGHNVLSESMVEESEIAVKNIQNLLVSNNTEGDSNHDVSLETIRSYRKEYNSFQNHISCNAESRFDTKHKDANICDLTDDKNIESPAMMKNSILKNVSKNCQNISQQLIKICDSGQESNTGNNKHFPNNMSETQTVQSPITSIIEVNDIEEINRSELLVTNSEQVKDEIVEIEYFEKNKSAQNKSESNLQSIEKKNNHDISNSRCFANYSDNYSMVKNLFNNLDAEWDSGFLSENKKCNGKTNLYHYRSPEKCIRNKVTETPFKECGELFKNVTPFKDFLTPFKDFANSFLPLKDTKTPSKDITPPINSGCTPIKDITTPFKDFNDSASKVNCQITKSGTPSPSNNKNSKSNLKCTEDETFFGLLSTNKENCNTSGILDINGTKIGRINVIKLSPLFKNGVRNEENLFDQTIQNMIKDEDSEKTDNLKNGNHSPLRQTSIGRKKTKSETNDKKSDERPSSDRTLRKRRNLSIVPEHEKPLSKKKKNKEVEMNQIVSERKTDTTPKPAKVKKASNKTTNPKQPVAKVKKCGRPKNANIDLLKKVKSLAQPSKPKGQIRYTRKDEYFTRKFHGLCDRPPRQNVKQEFKSNLLSDLEINKTGPVLISRMSRYRPIIPKPQNFDTNMQKIVNLDDADVKNRKKNAKIDRKSRTHRSSQRGSAYEHMKYYIENNSEHFLEQDMQGLCDRPPKQNEEAEFKSNLLSELEINKNGPVLIPCMSRYRPIIPKPPNFDAIMQKTVNLDDADVKNQEKNKKIDDKSRTHRSSQRGSDYEHMQFYIENNSEHFPEQDTPGVIDVINDQSIIILPVNYCSNASNSVIDPNRIHPITYLPDINNYRNMDNCAVSSNIDSGTSDKTKNGEFNVNDTYKYMANTTENVGFNSEANNPTEIVIIDDDDSRSSPGATINEEIDNLSKYIVLNNKGSNNNFHKTEISTQDKNLNNTKDKSEGCSSDPLADFYEIRKDIVSCVLKPVLDKTVVDIMTADKSRTSQIFNTIMSGLLDVFDKHNIDSNIKTIFDNYR